MIFFLWLAGLVALVVGRDVLLVSGAVYQRANSLGWKVKKLNIVPLNLLALQSS